MIILRINIEYIDIKLTKPVNSVLDKSYSFSILHAIFNKLLFVQVVGDWI